MTSKYDQMTLVDAELRAYGVARARDAAFNAVLDLWQRRKSEGWTQKRLAEAIGRDTAWVSRSLRGPGNWTIRTLGEFAQALDGELEIQLFALEDPISPAPNYDAYDCYGTRAIDSNYVYSPSNTRTSTGSRFVIVPAV